MSLPIRIVLVVVAFFVVLAALSIALPIMGIGVGDWQYPLAVGIAIGVVRILAKN